MTFDAITRNEDLQIYIKKADESLKALGYTEHSFPHVLKTAENAAMILSELDYDSHTVELTKIAAYLHDIGNLVNRTGHSESGALIAFRLLDKLGMSADETATIVTAIGNHDEGTGVPVSPVAAALIIADKCDVRRSRVRNAHRDAFDIHDRVNYSATSSEIKISRENKTITLKLTIDTEISSVMEYFQIFLGRMQMSKGAAEALGMSFMLEINGQLMT